MREIPNTWQELLFLIASWKHRFSLLHQSRLRRRQQLGLLRPVELGPEVTVSSQQARYITKFGQSYLIWQYRYKAGALCINRLGPLAVLAQAPYFWKIESVLLIHPSVVSGWGGSEAQGKSSNPPGYVGNLLGGF